MKNQQQFEEKLDAKIKELGLHLGYAQKDKIDKLKSFLSSHTLPKQAVVEFLEKNKREEYLILDCENCGNEGWGKAWYGKGRATGDNWGDSHYPTGSVVFCKECSPQFEIGKDWQGEEIWKRTSSNPDNNPEWEKVRINQITKKSSENTGYNLALSSLKEWVEKYGKE